MLEQIAPIAAALDSAHGNDACSDALAQQFDKLREPALTPSAQILADMKRLDLPFFTLAMEQSRRWATHFAEQPLAADKLAEFRRESEASIERQKAVEAADEIDFETYLERYYRQYDSL